MKMMIYCTDFHMNYVELNRFSLLLHLGMDRNLQLAVRQPGLGMPFLLSEPSNKHD